MTFEDLEFGIIKAICSLGLKLKAAPAKFYPKKNYFSI